MRVGDRVRCTGMAMNDGMFGIPGRIYTVSFVGDIHIQCRELGNFQLTPARFEVVRDEVTVAEPQAEQSVVLYTVVYIESNGEVKSFGFDTEERAQSRKQYLEGLQVRILGMKKITLRGMGA